MRDYNAPVYFTFNHEPESSASFAMGESPDFIAAWRNVYRIFQERGATNVKFMWIMTDYSFFVGPQARNDASKWYPGDAYLEAMGADAYNWYNCRTGINTPWWTLEQIIRPFRDFGAAHPAEELWLSEFASAEDAGSSGTQGRVGQPGAGPVQAAGLCAVPRHQRLRLPVHVTAVPVVLRQQHFVGGRLPGARSRLVLSWIDDTAAAAAHV